MDSIVPEEAERSTFVLFATAAGALLCRPAASSAPARAALAGRFPTWAGVIRRRTGGWPKCRRSGGTFLIGHFHEFGRSPGSRILRRGQPDLVFVTPLFYRWISHPLYLGFILAFWAAPRMSLGHLFFAAATTGYILIGVWFEERDPARRRRALSSLSSDRRYAAAQTPGPDDRPSFRETRI